MGGSSSLGYGRPPPPDRGPARLLPLSVCAGNCARPGPTRAPRDRPLTDFTWWLPRKRWSDLNVVLGAAVHPPTRSARRNSLVQLFDRKCPTWARSKVPSLPGVFGITRWLLVLRLLGRGLGPPGVAPPGPRALPSVPAASLFTRRSPVLLSCFELTGSPTTLTSLGGDAPQSSGGQCRPRHSLGAPGGWSGLTRSHAWLLQLPRQQGSVALHRILAVPLHTRGPGFLSSTSGW
ncbi:hypothetical protein NDU88_010372 [Pleurodeles waltl]|uniref:Uncharacterized protein n=1 Tax=Pleurodeles waltl TaxID=8319 RepID=A0AAV7S3T7_PLEWA|nr:hypothetical protein NDU88_010372 [Pleurodeles waltl]